MKIIWVSRGRNMVQEKMYILQTTKRRKANWISHILRRNYLLNHITEGRTAVAGR
jgi:hypothetical protein